jgi:hypothetical protein
MKLFQLRVAEVCADFANNYLKYDDAHIFDMFNEIQHAVMPPLDKLAAAEVLACHGVADGRHTFYGLLLRWVIMPDFDKAGSPGDTAQLPLFCAGDRDGRAVADCPPATDANTPIDAPAQTSHSDAPRPTQSNQIAGP